MCKIPGVGPISPSTAKAIASDAFLTGLFYDGTDLRHFRRWTRNIPFEVLLSLQLGEPPEFEGVKCSDCGYRFRNERDHTAPHVAGGCLDHQSQVALLRVSSEEDRARSGKRKAYAPESGSRAGAAGRLTTEHHSWIA